jgi:tellurium resistance protein TerD
MFFKASGVFVMGISLVKGGNISLAKAASSSGSSSDLRKVTVGLGWDPRATDGQEFDLDAVIFLCSSNGKVRSNADFIFYNQPQSADGSVVHQGDNRSGVGDGDDEVVEVQLSSIDSSIEKVAFAVTIHDADTRRQNFGMVNNAYVRVVNSSDGKEIARFDLSEDSSLETAMVFAELYKRNNEWKFKAIGQGYSGGLGGLASSYGVQL